MPEHPTRNLRWTLASLAVLALDQASKAWVLAAFAPGDSVPVLPFLDLVLVFNTGAAFSFLAGASGWQRWLFVALGFGAGAGILWLMRRGGHRSFLLALALILGGAAGNVWDRLQLGRVVDFVLLHYGGWHWPAFNVADSAITVGALLLVLDGFRQRHDGRAERVAGGRP